jgi:hypothetical protein
MLLYSDVLTGDEMFSDAFPVCVSILHVRSLQFRGPNSSRETRKFVDDIVYEVDGSLITVKPGADVNIGNVDSQTTPMG